MRGGGGVGERREPAERGGARVEAQRGPLEVERRGRDARAVRALGDAQQPEAQLAAEPDESAPLSPRSREAGTEAARPKGFKKSVQAVVAGKRVRVAAGGDTGDEGPSRSAGGPDEQTL